jgi:hypothetical protein
MRRVVAHAHNDNGIGNAGGRSLRMLVVLRALNMDRVMEGFLRAALDAGHIVQVALERRKVGPTTEGASLFDALATEYSTFSYGSLPPREEPWLHTATKLRSAIDYLRYFEPEFANADPLRDRARSRAPWYARLPAALGLLRLAPLRHAMDRFLRVVERRMPVSEESLAVMRDFQPDVVLVSPLVETGSAQGDHLRAADALGIPTVLLVASWDNLTTKGVIRDVPDMTIVWNDDQVREAIDMHGLPAENIVTTGAHSHDHWFAWQPATGREEFAAKVGLAADRPFLLYVCSSGFIVGHEEVAFVREWVQRLRGSGDPELERLGVLVRPHPQNFDSWSDAELDQPGRLVVWPRGGVAPTDRQSKEDYFDSLYHAKAVVGLNTTALVDSAIVHRPVFTLIQERFRDTQTGTLHFSYLAREEGNGLLRVAHSWDEHFDHLGAALRSADGHRDQIDRFLSAFIRPHGLEQPAAPLALDAVVRTALRGKEPVRKGGLFRWMVGVMASALGLLHLALEWLRPRAVRRRLHKWRRKRVRSQRRKAASQRKELRTAKPGKAKKPPKEPQAVERGEDGRGQKLPAQSKRESESASKTSS